MSALLILAYLGGSLLGIGALAAALHRFGHSGGALDADEADRLARAAGGEGAPLEVENARLYAAAGGVVVVRLAGRHPVAARLDAAAVRSVKATPDGLMLRTRAFDAPALSLRTDDPVAVRDWLAARGVLPR